MRSAIRFFPDPPGIVTAVEGGVSITSIKYHPISKTQLRPPLAPSGTCGASSLPEGAVFPLAFAFSHWIFGNRKCLLWNPSVKNQRFLPAPFHKGASGVPPVSMRTVAFCDSLLPLQCPVSAACPPNLFTIHSSLFTKNAWYRYRVVVDAQTKAPLAIVGVVWR